MRSYNPHGELDEWERDELSKLKAEPWMLACLALNPGYVCWGPGEDYMSTRDKGWATSASIDTWAEFLSGYMLDDWNECVHFYFEVSRAAINCTACDRSGYNPETKQISDDFYDFPETGRRWCDNITQDEVDALIEAQRLWDFWRRFGPNGWEDIVPKPTITAEMVNEANQQPGAHSHDAINRCILIRARAQRLGVYGLCAQCGGSGSVFTEPAAKLGLTLWWLHPRKGASKGIRIVEITKDELPAAKAFLAEAARRNAERFARVVAEGKT